MTMRLRGTALLSAIEEGEKLVCVGLTRGLLPFSQDSICDSDIVFLEPCRLFPFFFGGKNEMFSNDWELVQDEEVRWIFDWDVGDEECRLGIDERVLFWLARCLVVGKLGDFLFILSSRLLCQ